ncbi:hypothetical protein HJFPF1_10168 [Paramyrothecium foliicola]|nr:hypothetical protein HJFPF1_10168 [Paramyrothecium foliicola]
MRFTMLHSVFVRYRWQGTVGTVSRVGFQATLSCYPATSETTALAWPWRHATLQCTELNLTTHRALPNTA